MVSFKGGRRKAGYYEDWEEGDGFKNESGECHILDENEDEFIAPHRSRILSAAAPLV